MMKPYQLLSEFYDKDEWGRFSLQYVQFINELKSKYSFPVRTVLDVSCGTGDLIYELSKDYKVVGSDISEEMIGIARKKYPALNFIVSDMTQLRLKEKFDLVLSPFDSMNYLVERRQLRKALSNIHNHSEEGGHFLFDFNTDKMYEELHHGIFEKTTSGVSYKQVCEYDKVKRIAKTIFDFGGDKRETHLQTAVRYEEMEDLLRECRFSIIHAYDIYNNRPVDENAYKILVLAELAGGSNG